MAHSPRVPPFARVAFTGGSCCCVPGRPRRRDVGTGLLLGHDPAGAGQVRNGPASRPGRRSRPDYTRRCRMTAIQRVLAQSPPTVSQCTGQRRPDGELGLRDLATAGPVLVNCAERKSPSIESAQSQPREVGRFRRIRLAEESRVDCISSCRLRFTLHILCTMSFICTDLVRRTPNAAQ